jgi:DNA-binding NarL/FixJ family response regulator
MLTALQSTSSPARAPRVLVVEDHPIYLEGLSITLSALHPDTNLICVASATAAQDYLRQDSQLDLIILDLGIPEGGGLSVLQFLCTQQLFIPAVVLSASEEHCDVQRSMRAGASGFISKSSSSQEILSAVRLVLGGEQTLPAFYQEQASQEQDDEFPLLTPRQQEVLQLVCEGLPNKRICLQLGLSEHTVKTHMKALFGLLKVHNRTECMRVALEWRLID